MQEEAKTMGRYLRRRLLTAIPVFFGITILVFCMLNLAQGSILDLMGEGVKLPDVPVTVEETVRTIQAAMEN